MGASGWSYVQAFSNDLASTLVALRERVLRDGGYHWDDYFDRDKPATLADLDEFRDQNDEFWEIGTHSILDIDHIEGSDAEDHEAMVRPLTTEECLSLFGTATPTEADFARVDEFDIDCARWSGRCQPLHTDATVTAVAFWGFSGD